MHKMVMLTEEMFFTIEATKRSVTIIDSNYVKADLE